MKRSFVLIPSIFLMFSGNALAEPETGSSDWQYDVSKAIALELADTPGWTLAASYLRELSPRSQDWNLLLLQAKVELQYGNIEEAQKIIERALSINNKNPRILALAGNISADSGRYDEAVDYFERVLVLQPRNVQVLMSLGRLRTARHEWEQVIELYERLLTLTSPTTEIYGRLAVAYENTGNLAKAEKCLVANLDIHPNRALALIPLERFYKKHGHTTQAAKISSELNKLQKREETRVMRSLQKSSK